MTIIKNMEAQKQNNMKPKVHELNKGHIIDSVDGYSVDGDDMHWIVNCPTCKLRLEYIGYFDSGEINKCRCGTEFKTKRVYLNDCDYIE